MRTVHSDEPNGRCQLKEVELSEAACFFMNLHSYSEVEYQTVNCKNTFEGIYNFTYEMQEGGGGICAHPNSIIVACQEPGE